MQKILFTLLLTTGICSKLFAVQIPQLVKDLTPGNGSTNIKEMVELNGKLVFVTDNSIGVSDGTAAGTNILKTFSNSVLYNGMKAMNGIVFFIGSDSTYGAELWKTDGTVAGTQLVKDINNGTASGLDALIHSTIGHSINYHLASMNGLLYFPANDGTHGTELWVSDGTDAGTHMVKDIFTTADSSALSYLPGITTTT